MAIKDVFVPLLLNGRHQGVFDAIETLEQFKDAHLSATLFSALPEPIFVGDGLAGGMAIGNFIESTFQEARDFEQKIAADLRKTTLRWDLRLFQGQSLTVQDEATLQARHCELCVMTRPAPEDSEVQREILEAVLMESGRPILALPPGWTVRPVFRKVLVAWNASREAARALGDAGPFMQGASEIVIAVVDPRPSTRGFGQDPGADISAHLARRGFSVQLNRVDNSGADHGATLIRMIEDSGADLLVMGGYGHSRLQQSLFGGVTRKLIEASPVPILMSH